MNRLRDQMGSQNMELARERDRVDALTRERDRVAHERDRMRQQVIRREAEYD